MRGNKVYTYSGSHVNCGTDNISLWVRRKPRPSGWKVQGESYIYNRSDNKTYANYNNSNAFGASRPYAERHLDGKPDVFPGKQAEFIATLRNTPYSNYQHINSSVQVVIESAYFGAIVVVVIMGIEFSLHAERSVIFITINAGQRLIT